MSHSFEDAASSKAHMAANAVVDVQATVQSGYADAEQLNQVTRAVNDWLVASRHIAASMGRVQELVTSH